MVYFVCDECGETMKKKRVLPHTDQCPNAAHFSCMDCQRVFDQSTYQAHTICITTEAHKFGGATHVPQASKGELRQDAWLRKVRAAIRRVNVPRLNRVLRAVYAHDSIPRKKAKFVNFLQNSLCIRDRALCVDAWRTIEMEAAALTKRTTDAEASAYATAEETAEDDEPHTGPTDWAAGRTLLSSGETERHTAKSAPMLEQLGSAHHSSGGGENNNNSSTTTTNTFILDDRQSNGDDGDENEGAGGGAIGEEANAEEMEEPPPCCSTPSSSSDGRPPFRLFSPYFLALQSAIDRFCRRDCRRPSVRRMASICDQFYAAAATLVMANNEGCANDQNCQTMMMALFRHNAKLLARLGGKLCPNCEDRLELVKMIAEQIADEGLVVDDRIVNDFCGGETPTVGEGRKSAETTFSDENDQLYAERSERNGTEQQQQNGIGNGDGMEHQQIGTGNENSTDQSDEHEQNGIGQQEEHLQYDIEHQEGHQQNGIEHGDGTDQPEEQQQNGIGQQKEHLQIRFELDDHSEQQLHEQNRQKSTENQEVHQQNGAEQSEQHRQHGTEQQEEHPQIAFELEDGIGLENDIEQQQDEEQRQKGTEEQHRLNGIERDVMGHQQICTGHENDAEQPEQNGQDGTVNVNVNDQPEELQLIGIGEEEQLIVGNNDTPNTTMKPRKERKLKTKRIDTPKSPTKAVTTPTTSSIGDSDRRRPQSAGMKKNQCDQCGELFRLKTELKVHMRLHDKRRSQIGSEHEDSTEQQPEQHRQNDTVNVNGTDQPEELQLIGIGEEEQLTSGKIGTAKNTMKPRMGRIDTPKSPKKAPTTHSSSGTGSRRRQSAGLENRCDQCGELFRLKTELKMHMRLHDKLRSQIDIEQSVEHNQTGTVNENGTNQPEELQLIGIGEKKQLTMERQPRMETKPRTKRIDTPKSPLKLPTKEVVATPTTSSIGDADRRRPQSAGLKNQCDQCGELFRLKTELKVHMRLHNKRRSQIGIKNGHAIGQQQQDAEHQQKSTEQPMEHNQTGTVNENGTDQPEEQQLISIEEEVQLTMERCGTSKIAKKPRTERKPRMGNIDTPKLSLKSPTKAIMATPTTSSSGGSDRPRRQSSGMKIRCDRCGKLIRCNAELIVHMRVHDKLRLQCSECDKSFVFESDLRLHNRAHHSDDRPYMCTRCGMAFVDARRLSIHLKLHAQFHSTPSRSQSAAGDTAQQHHFTANDSDARPFQCELCCAHFAVALSLKKHMRTHDRMPITARQTPSIIGRKRKIEAAETTAQSADFVDFVLAKKQTDSSTAEKATDFADFVLDNGQKRQRQRNFSSSQK